jgi:REP-associated tyrosine transposase
MVRMARVVLPGSPHHITQRGIRRFDIFRDEPDRLFYVTTLVRASSEFGLRVCAYCLMTNHVHFVAIPEKADSIWKTFHRCHGFYALHFNRKYGLAGHLFQGRPYSCGLDEPHFWSAIRYVECNPVRAGMVRWAEDYEWSSARAHCIGTIDSLLDPDWPGVHQVPNWSSWLRDDENPDVLSQNRSHSFTGRPCGDSNFIRIAERNTGRRLTRQKPGPKSTNDNESGPILWIFDENRN